MLLSTLLQDYITMAVTVTFVKFSLNFILSSQPLLFLMPSAVSYMIMLTIFPWSVIQFGICKMVL